MFPRLFQAGRIGTLELKNRIIMSPMLTCYADGEYVSDRLIGFLTARASGGAGLIITEVAHVNPMGRLEPNELAIYDDKFLPGLKRLTDTVHEQGAKIAMQIGHGGGRSRSKVIGTQPVSASNVAGAFAEIPRALSLDEISFLIEDFTRAALRAQKAGFDGIELHYAHGYLLRQFISPYTNKRTDEYGGDINGRAKFGCDILQSVRSAVGDYPVWVRINGSDFVDDGGSTLDDAKILGRLFQDKGADAIDVSAGTYESTKWTTQTSVLPPGCLVHLAEGVKNGVNVPVITVGRINSPDVAEDILKKGKADFIAMGRALIADPDFPRKAREGKTGEIRRCVADNACIDNLIFTGLKCTVNPRVGKESEAIIPSDVRKRVLIAGAGPGGMEAAYFCALRGHEVLLCDKSSKLGGQIEIARRPPFKEELDLITAYTGARLEKLGVRIMLNKEVTREVVEELTPDVCILATGSVPMRPAIPGIEQGNVITAQDVLLNKAETGEKVLIIGGGRTGLETAEYLAARGRKVTVIEKLKRMGSGLGITTLPPLLERLAGFGTVLMALTEVEEIKDRAVTVIKDGSKTTVEGDTIVLAVGSTPVNELEKELAGMLELHMIGDCVKPRNILEAKEEAYNIAIKI